MIFIGVYFVIFLLACAPVVVCLVHERLRRASVLAVCVLMGAGALGLAAASTSVEPGFPFIRNEAAMRQEWLLLLGSFVCLVLGFGGLLVLLLVAADRPVAQFDPDADSSSLPNPPTKTKHRNRGAR